MDFLNFFTHPRIVKEASYKNKKEKKSLRAENRLLFESAVN